MVRLKVRVQPGARRNEIVGLQEGVLRVRVTAPPAEGRANAALISFLADVFHIRKSEILIVSGQASRDKLLEIASLDEQQLKQILSSL